MTRRSSLSLSKHARRRSQQRGFSYEDLELILQYGTPYRAGWSKEPISAYWFTRRSLNRLKQRERHEHLANSAVIMSDSGTIMTVFHVKRRPRYWRSARH